MSENIKWTVKQSDGRLRVSLSGQMTDSVRFAPLLEELEIHGSDARIQIDLSGITRINSFGVGRWIRFLGSVLDGSREVHLARCSPPVVHQLAMIPIFLGKSHLESVLAPYFCVSCEKGQINVIDFLDQKPQAPAETMPCPECKKDMVFDDLLEFYSDLASSQQ